MATVITESDDLLGEVPPRRVAGLRSALRSEPAGSACLGGDHRLWWQVEAADERAALALLPSFVAARTAAVSVRKTAIP